LLVLLGLLFIATSCADPEAAPQASDAALEIPETTIKACVNNRGDTPPAEATGDEFKTIKGGVLTVGSDTAFPPFEEIKNGVAVGFDVDLINEVADRIGVPKVDYQTAVFDTIFTALAADKYDVVISAVTIKASRKQTVDFTDPYFNGDQSLSVLDSQSSVVGGVDDLKGKTVGVQSGTTGEDCAKNALKAKGRAEEVRSYDTAVDAFTDLAAKRVDAVLVDLPTAKSIVEGREGASVVQVIRTNEDYGIAVSKKNPNLREQINTALSDLRDDGTYAKLFRKWFDTEPPA
jgi:ABC-type amino acid transport substrate-binding protein